MTVVGCLSDNIRAYLLISAPCSEPSWVHKAYLSVFMQAFHPIHKQCYHVTSKWYLRCIIFIKSSIWFQICGLTLPSTLKHEELNWMSFILWFLTTSPLKVILKFFYDTKAWLRSLNMLSLSHLLLSTCWGVVGQNTKLQYFLTDSPACQVVTPTII